MTGLRVAIVGTGPAGLYALSDLLDRPQIAVSVDLYERLPTPWGLIRAGVAPDHANKKVVVDKLFAAALRDPRVRFFGNVEIGKDIGVDCLAKAYDAVIYAVGADGDFRLKIAGEDLPGCWAARDFVSFYNGHPDSSDHVFDLSCERAVIVGNGNVALDVARILTLPVAQLETTDIADRALDLLRESRIREVVILGRRDAYHAAFHNPELEELERLPGVEIVVEGDLTSSPATIGNSNYARDAQRKIETLRRLSTRASNGGARRIILRFLASPLELLGDGRVEYMRIGHNQIETDPRGASRASPTGETSMLKTGFVLRAIGYRGGPLPGLPFDAERAVIANVEGRVTDAAGRVVPGAYVTGWVKRGCRGIIGSNRKCAGETVRMLIDDYGRGLLPRSAHHAEIDSLIEQAVPQRLSLPGWLAIDRAERERGRAAGRPRVKFTERSTLLEAART